MLAGLGARRITVVDHDRVSEANLNRQLLHRRSDVGRMKAAAAADRLAHLDPDLECVPLITEVASRSDLEVLLPGHDLVLAMIDKPAKVRLWVNDAC